MAKSAALEAPEEATMVAAEPVEKQASTADLIETRLNSLPHSITARYREARAIEFGNFPAEKAVDVLNRDFTQRKLYLNAFAAVRLEDRSSSTQFRNILEDLCDKPARIAALRTFLRNVDERLAAFSAVHVGKTEALQDDGFYLEILHGIKEPESLAVAATGMTGFPYVTHARKFSEYLVSASSDPAVHRATAESIGWDEARYIINTAEKILTTSGDRRSIATLMHKIEESERDAAAKITPSELAQLSDIMRKSGDPGVQVAGLSRMRDVCWNPASTPEKMQTLASGISTAEAQAQYLRMLTDISIRHRHNADTGKIEEMYYSSHLEKNRHQRNAAYTHVLQLLQSVEIGTPNANTVRQTVLFLKNIESEDYEKMKELTMKAFTDADLVIELKSLLEFKKNDYRLFAHIREHAPSSSSHAALSKLLPTLQGHWLEKELRLLREQALQEVSLRDPASIPLLRSLANAVRILPLTGAVRYREVRQLRTKTTDAVVIANLAKCLPLKDFVEGDERESYVRNFAELDALAAIPTDDNAAKEAIAAAAARIQVTKPKFAAKGG